MALADIIAAIQAQADAEISAIEERTQHEKDAIKRATDEEIAAFEAALKEETLQKRAAMRKKAETQVEMEQRKALLLEKRRALDAVYAKVEEAVKNLPKAKIRKLEDALRKKVKGRKGEIRASKDGGFVFVSEKEEEDFTFPHLIQTMLRPGTELDVASTLFA